MSKVKAPYFPFYVDDFLASPAVNLMTPEQRGLYIMLIARSWQSGGSLPNDPKVLWKLAGAPNRKRFQIVSGPVLEQFLSENGRLFNQRVKSEWDKFLAKSERGKANIDKRWKMEEVSNAPLPQEDGGNTESQLSILEGIPDGYHADTEGIHLAIPKAYLPEPEPEPDKSNTSDCVKSEHKKAVQEVWEFYIAAMDKNPRNYLFTTKRQKMGMARLKEALVKAEGNLTNAIVLMKIPVEQLIISKYHLENKYDDWDNLYRSPEMFDKWLRRSDPARRPESDEAYC